MQRGAKLPLLGMSSPDPGRAEPRPRLIASTVISLPPLGSILESIATHGLVDL